MKSDMEKKKHPDYPVLEESTYTEDIEKGIADAERKAAEIERQAKRDRDMALIGDMAHLVAQGAAMHGGAWKIGQTQSEGAKGNERLRVLREKNAAQAAAFAKERAALREAKRKEENARKLAAYNAERDAYKEAMAQANADRTFKATEEYREKQLKLQKEREERLKKQGGSGSGVNRDVYLLNDDGTKENFKHADYANNVQAAYAKLPEEYKVKKEVNLYEKDDQERSTLRIDEKGMPVTQWVVNPKPTLDEKKQAIENYNARDLVEDWAPEEDEIIDYEP